MNNGSKKYVELKEYQPARFCADEIPYDIGTTLWSNYGNQIDVEFPSPKTDGMWQLTSKGWVGHIPVKEDFVVILSPKIPLFNLFQMLEHAYQLKSFHFLKGIVDCDSIQDFYERFANILALRVLDRNRNGFYRRYESEEEILPFVRGKIDMSRVQRKPWEVNIKCYYEELSPDVEDNQILTWTLYKIAHSGMCTERILPAVRRAYRSLQGLTSLFSHSPDSCINRIYNRLNSDYEPMHALCRFFLMHCGPSHNIGDKKIIPFLVNMARLFELFVAEWLRKNLPQGYSLKYQEKVNIGDEDGMSFDIDMVIYDSKSGEASHVIDTKYKAPDHPSPDDIAQIVAYSESKNCKEAILLYPQKLKKNINGWIGDNKVRNLEFMIDVDLDAAGGKLIKSLFSYCNKDDPGLNYRQISHSPG